MATPSGASPRGRPERARRSLRTRLALWMISSTMLTLIAFAGTVYWLVRSEVAEGEDVQHEDAREQVLMAMLLAGPACLVASVVGAWVLSTRALTPLHAVVRTTADITAENLHRRLEVPRRDDELRDLVVALNALLARLDDGFSAVESFASSASHELRTPIAVVRNELEVALRRPRLREEWESVARASLDELHRLARLVEALLDLARAAGGSTAHEPFELRAQLDETLASLVAEANNAGVHLVPPKEGSLAWVRGDADLVMNAVREVVRNAARYAPGGSTVRVRVDTLATGQEVAIHVDDEGPGVGPLEREMIFAPFSRGVRGRASDGLKPNGLGLGLAIAKRSVESSGGTIEATESPEGGARFTLRLLLSNAPS